MAGSRSGLPEVQRPEFVVLAEGYDFIEAPRVSDDGTVWFSDLRKGGIHRLRAGEPPQHFASERLWIGGIAFCEDEGLIVSGRGGLARLDQQSGELSPLTLESPDSFELCVNDIEAAPDGSLIGGTIDFVSIMEKQEPFAPGTLFRMAPNGQVTILREGVGVTNGLGFSPCGSWLYHSETGKGVWRYPLDAEGIPDCAAGDVFVALEDSDGLVVDSEGGFWVAGWASGTLRHYRADGTCDQVVDLPFPHVISLAFGGADLGELYVSTGSNDAEPARGSVLKFRVDVPGIRDHKAKVGVKMQVQ